MTDSPPWFPSLTTGGDAIAMVDGDRPVTYSELHDRVGWVTGGLLDGAESLEEERVAFLYPASPEYAALIIGIVAAGGIAVPLSVHASPAELAHCLSVAGSSRLLLPEVLRSDELSLVCNEYGISQLDISDLPEGRMPDTLPISAEQGALIVFTSGTTGKPKGVIRNHEGYYHLSSITSIELKIKKEDKALLVMPLCHANSFNFFCAYIFAGASIYIYSKPSFNCQYFFKVLKKHHCTFTSLVPTHFIIMLDYIKKYNKNNIIKHKFNFMISSAPARKDTKQLILKYFKNANLYELYGSSESGWVTMLHPEEQFSHLGTVGKECIGSKAIKIMNDDLKEVKDGVIGELYASTPYNFLGYWKNKNKTKEAFIDDYVSVGDLAYRNKNGFIVLVDRKKNMIISGGENIYPSEVENVLGKHNSIKDLAIVGCQDKKWGEIVCAFVILHDNMKLTEHNLIGWAKKRLASYKCPKKVFFIDDNEMPRNATGKILHKDLRDKANSLIKIIS